MVRIKDTQLVETVTGTWLRFPNSFKKFNCLVELPGHLTMNINSKSGSIHIHKKDSNNVYQPLGELTLGNAGNQLQSVVHGVQAGPMQHGGVPIGTLGTYENGEKPVRQSDAS
ncbi:hypothetical protein [Paenibacillus puerhi]|uniref:hypothetical protein n=1 Tax=Paenibacillus puerhi TaxID=2692622 RepID=UPI001915F4FA|nr:hypothetical protein [Paenibacillus puerhi]